MKFSEVMIQMQNTPTKKFAREYWKTRDGFTNRYIVLMSEICMSECLFTPNTKSILGVPEHRGFKIRPFLLIKTRYDYEFTTYHPTYEEFTADDWKEFII